MASFSKTFDFNFRRDHQKNFLWASRLWVGRRKELILGYVPKNDEKKNSGGKGLRGTESPVSPRKLPQVCLIDWNFGSNLVLMAIKASYPISQQAWKSKNSQRMYTSPLSVNKTQLKQTYSFISFFNNVSFSKCKLNLLCRKGYQSAPNESMEKTYIYAECTKTNYLLFCWSGYCICTYAYINIAIYKNRKRQLMIKILWEKDVGVWYDDWWIYGRRRK